MRPEVLKFLHDVADSIAILELYAQRATMTILQQDTLLFDGIKHRLAISGEAFYQIGKLDKKFSLTGMRKIAGFRHIIAHDYDKVDPAESLSIFKNIFPF